MDDCVGDDGAGGAAKGREEGGEVTPSDGGNDWHVVDDEQADMLGNFVEDDTLQPDDPELVMKQALELEKEKSALAE